MSSPALSSLGVDGNRTACRVWWRGFLANRAALVQELGLTAVQAGTDEQLIASAYLRWGTKLQTHLLGEYALAVLDLATDSLLLTHDALGVVPLYYSLRATTVYFGSHLSLLVALIPGAGLDESFIAQSLLQGECLGERTIYRNVKRLGVGRTLRYRRGGAVQLQSWLLSDTPELRYSNPRDYEERFRQLIKEAVTTSVHGRTWSELSGGLDSSTIACVAVQLGVTDFETVSAIYPKSVTSNELSWIDIVRSEKGLRGHLIDGDAYQPFSALPDRILDEPSRLHITWPLFQEYEKLLRARGVDVLLSGLGGDQVLFGETTHPLHLADDVRRLRLLSAIRQLAQWPSAQATRSLTHRMLTSAINPALQYMRGRAIAYRPDGAGGPHSAWVSLKLLRRTGVESERAKSPTPRMPTVRGQLYYETIWRMASNAGRHWAQNTTAYQWRHPLLYRPLVEFMYSLPWQQQVEPGHDRPLQRRAMAGILPERIRQRRTKSGPSQAICEGLRANRNVRRLLTEHPLIAQLGYVELTAWRATVDAAQFGHVPSWPAFEAAVSLEIWLRKQHGLVI